MSKDRFIITGVGKRRLTKGNRPVLTARETEVIALAALGLSACEIARVLFISERTVNWHRDNVLECFRLGCQKSGSLIKVLNLLGTWTPHDPALAEKVAEFRAQLGQEKGPL